MTAVDRRTAILAAGVRVNLYIACMCIYMLLAFVRAYVTITCGICVLEIHRCDPSCCDLSCEGQETTHYVTSF